MIRFLFSIGLLLVVAGCSGQAFDPEKPVDPIGDFSLGHLGIVAPNPQKLLVSRDATPEEWIELLDTTLGGRFSRFEGARVYHFGISVEGYSLPPPVVPGKSYLALNITVWDDAKQAKLNPEPKLMAVPLLIESRLAASREDSMQALANETARVIEGWLRKQMTDEGWFVPQPTPAVTVDTPQAPVEGLSQ